METSKSIHERFAAAWSEAENPPLDGVNPHFSSRYAKLESILKAIRKACKSHGIMYKQTLVRHGEAYFLESAVMSEDGNIMELSTFPVEVSSNPQKLGSNLTYIKRQQAQVDWGIVGEDDDDGNAAVGNSQAFNARCRSCGATCEFQNKEQFEAYRRNMNCCQQPDYEVI